MRNAILWFARIARALGHNGALSDEEAQNCSSLRAANALMRAAGINYNDALPRDQKWMSGKEGWDEVDDDIYGKGVMHTTASGRLTVTIHGRTFELRFESGAVNDFGNHLVALLYLNDEEEDGMRVYPQVVSNLLAGRPDRIALLEKIDVTGELIGSLRKLANAVPEQSGTKEARQIVDAIDSLLVAETESPAVVQ